MTYAGHTQIQEATELPVGRLQEVWKYCESSGRTIALDVVTTGLVVSNPSIETWPVSWDDCSQ